MEVTMERSDSEHECSVNSEQLQKIVPGKVLTSEARFQCWSLDVFHDEDMSIR